MLHENPLAVSSAPGQHLEKLEKLEKVEKIPKVGSVFLKVGFSQGRVLKYKRLHEIFPRCMLDIFSRSARVFSRSRRVFPRSILTFLKVASGFLTIIYVDKRLELHTTVLVVFLVAF